MEALRRLPTWAKVLLAILFLPIAICYGIYVMWKQQRFSLPVRILLTGVGGLLVLSMLASAGGNQETSTPPVAPAAVQKSASPRTPVTEAPAAEESADVAPVMTEETAPPVAAPIPAPTPAPEPTPRPAAVAPKVAKPAPRPAPAAEVTVYGTRTGKRYHVSGCSSLRRSKIPMTISEAKARGLTPCGNCNPPS